MIHQKLELPGLDRTRTRFLGTLDNSVAAIAGHAVGAWESNALDDINGNLGSARGMLDQIAGSAGSLGFDDLCAHARTVEKAIADHLGGTDADLAICPGGLIFHLDHFVQNCQALISTNVQSVDPAP
jgi:hypothetical protein